MKFEDVRVGQLYWLRQPESGPGPGLLRSVICVRKDERLSQPPLVYVGHVQGVDDETLACPVDLEDLLPLDAASGPQY